MYCKAMKRWLSGMLLFALVLGLGAPASANLLYTAQTYYSNTKLGKIVGDTATILKIPMGPTPAPLLAAEKL